MCIFTFVYEVMEFHLQISVGTLHYDGIVHEYPRRYPRRTFRYSIKICRISFFLLAGNNYSTASIIYDTAQNQSPSEQAKDKYKVTIKIVHHIHRPTYLLYHRLAHMYKVTRFIQANNKIQIIL